LQAEKQQRELLFETDLGFGRQLQAHSGATEVDIHHNCCWMALRHGVAKGGQVAECLGAELKKIQLLGQSVRALQVLQQDIHRLAQRWQADVGHQIVLAQTGARQALHQTVELGDDLAAQATVIGRHVL